LSALLLRVCNASQIGQKHGCDPSRLPRISSLALPQIFLARRTDI
jgi:hypothetical protein